MLGSMQEAPMTILSVKDSSNLWQNGCISPLPEKAEEISMNTASLKRMGESLCSCIHRGVWFTLVQTHQNCKMRKVDEF